MQLFIVVWVSVREPTGDTEKPKDWQPWGVVSPRLKGPKEAAVLPDANDRTVEKELLNRNCRLGQMKAVSEM